MIKKNYITSITAPQGIDHKRLWVGPRYCEGVEGRQRIVAYSLGHLVRYYNNDFGNNCEPMVKEIISEHIAPTHLVRRFDPLSKFEWSLTGQSPPHSTGSLWTFIAVDDQPATWSTFRQSLEFLKPTYALLWDRKLMRSLMEQAGTPLIASTSARLLQHRLRLSNGQICHLLGTDNPTTIYNWVMWNEIFNKLNLKYIQK